MKCLIVEDELPAVKILENHISYFPDITISNIHNNAMDAFVDLQKSSVDILFLDINLPKMSGIQLLHALKNKPAVIMTTAHREFALDGYELDIFDYLLKPISFERFAKAVSKVYLHLKKDYNIPRIEKTVSENLISEPFVYVKSEREYVKIIIDKIEYIESIKNHVKIITKEGTFITLISLTQIEEKLPPQYFLRIHRSFIISLMHLSRFSHTHVSVNNKTIPIGRHYKNEFLKWVKGNMV